MQKIETYSAQNDKLRLLLQGSPGVGKTTLGCQFLGAYVIDVDVNLGGSLRWIKEHNKVLPVGYSLLDRDEEGKEIPVAFRYQRLSKLLLEAQVNDAVKTIVIDSATTLVDVLTAEVLRQQVKKEMGIREWGFFLTLGKTFMYLLTSMRKHVVLIAHEKLNTNENGAIVYPVQVAWPGQLGQIIGAFFTNVWRCEVELGLNNSYKWNIRTMPDYRYQLKNSLGLPPVFEFNWETIQQKLTS